MSPMGRGFCTLLSVKDDVRWKCIETVVRSSACGLWRLENRMLNKIKVTLAVTESLLL